VRISNAAFASYGFARGNFLAFKGIIVKNIGFIIIVLSICLSLGCESLAEVSNEQHQGFARQVRIYREALLNGTTEQGRLDAAMELLDGGAESRTVLLEVLSADDNPLASKAVCGALVASRPRRQSLKDRGDFLEPLLKMLSNSRIQDPHLVAQALLIYDYSEVSGKLNKMARSAQLERQIRSNEFGSKDRSNISPC